MSMESYYQGILTAAAEAGLNSPEELLSVLWHAPWGNACQPERLGYLQQLVAPAQVQPNPAPDRAARRGFLSTRQGQSPKPGRAMRTPFSCRKIRGDLRKI
jgi:hypothetical protein